MVEKLRSNGPGEGLAECDLDVGDPILCETPCSARPRPRRSRGRVSWASRPPKGRGTRFLSGFGKADGVDARPLEINGIVELFNLAGAQCDQTGLASFGMRWASRRAPFGR